MLNNVEHEQDIEFKIKEIEAMMNGGDFWADKMLANQKMKELKVLKNKLLGDKALDSGGATLSILSGAGGDDSEDWARMLLDMYICYFEMRNKTNSVRVNVLHKHENEHRGIKNVTLEVVGDNVYGDMKGESGVHRLVRISPFNAAAKRHTSFALVEVLPIVDESIEVDMNRDDLDIITQKSGGPGGQNVNKRETAVRIVHKKTGLSVHVSDERSQEANRDKALKLMRSKLYALKLAELKAEKEGLKISSTTEVEWGNQIRNYVLHPYKLVKDLRTGVETSDTEYVLRGNIEEFIAAGKSL